ncbi:hypothetical protein AAVH_32605 [Aphelenchoides avenae]|nr:hypothetical protein AAVH_32605 [Aphelenchus avenae]
MSAYGRYLQRSLSNASIAGDGASYAERGLYRSYSLPEVVTTLPHLSLHERAHYAYQPRYYVPTFSNPYRFYVGGNYGHYSGYNWRNYWNWSSRPEYIYSRPREYPT